MSVLLLLSIMLYGSVTVSFRQPIATEPTPTPKPIQEQVAMEAPKQAEYRKLTAQEAKAQLDKDKTIKLIDVRTEEEYREKRIADSVLIPDYDIEKLAPKLLPNKSDKLFIYCRSGRRSKGAAMKLLSMGYTNVYDIGGIIDWPYETVSGK